METRKKNWGGFRGIVFGCILFLVLALGQKVKAQAAVELSKTYIILHLGQEGEDTYSMEVSGLGKGSTVVFSIKDPAVAVVDGDGKVMAVSPGKTTLVCTVTDAKGKETTKKATVRVYDNIKSITLSIRDVQKNALHKNQAYALTYTCKTVAGTNQNAGNYIHYEVLSEQGKTVTDASVDQDGNFTAKRADSYLVRAYAFQSESLYKKWEKSRVKYAEYILAQDELCLTVTETKYKKSTHKIGNYSVSLPEDYEVDILEKGKERIVFSAQAKRADGQNAVSNIQVIIDGVDEAQEYGLLASVLSSVYTKENLEEHWKSAYHAKKATVKGLKIQRITAKEREILEIQYQLTLRDIVLTGKEAADIKISRMDFVNTVYTWYEGNNHISVTVNDAKESLQPNITDAAFDLVEEFLVPEKEK
ncbi:MAG: Ig-like domain-containing protein [Lachnospiraceae bacterium]|nr:Ig-like domain-containing protein [Lachnospiraceae bacterium]